MKRWDISYRFRRKDRALWGLGFRTVAAPDERTALRALELQLRKALGEQYEFHQIWKVTEHKE